MTTKASVKELLSKLYKAQEITITAYYALGLAVTQLEDCEREDHK